MLESSMRTLLGQGGLGHFSTSIVSTDAQKGIKVSHTKSIVATSLAVVKCGLPALGFGSLAIISSPSSMVSWNTLLYWPSEIFNTWVHDCAPTTEAASCRSAERLKLTWRQASCCCSFQSHRPEVNRFSASGSCFESMISFLSLELSEEKEATRRVS